MLEARERIGEQQIVENACRRRAWSPAARRRSARAARWRRGGACRGRRAAPGPPSATTKPCSRRVQRALAAPGRSHERRRIRRARSSRLKSCSTGPVAGVAEAARRETRCAPAARSLRGTTPRVHGSDRHVHDVGEPPHRDRRLLELLPQPDEPQHRLRDARREHLEGDQHADREVGPRITSQAPTHRIAVLQDLLERRRRACCRCWRAGAC